MWTAQDRKKPDNLFLPLKQVGELQLRMTPELESVSAQRHNVLLNVRHCSLAKDRGGTYRRCYCSHHNTIYSVVHNTGSNNS